MIDRRYKTELKKLGNRIRDIRKAKKLVQLDLEISSGISRTDISKIENGIKNIEFHTIVKIAIALNIEVSQLFE